MELLCWAVRVLACNAIKCELVYSVEYSIDLFNWCIVEMLSKSIYLKRERGVRCTARRLFKLVRERQLIEVAKSCYHDLRPGNAYRTRVTAEALEIWGYSFKVTFFWLSKYHVTLYHEVLVFIKFLQARKRVQMKLTLSRFRTIRTQTLNNRKKFSTI